MEQTSKKKSSKPYSPEFRERAVRLPEAVHDQMQRELEVVRFLFAETVAAGRGERLTQTAALATEAAVFRGPDAVAAGLADDLADPVTAFRAFAAAPRGTTSPSRKGPQMTNMPTETPNPAPVAAPPVALPAVARYSNRPCLLNRRRWPEIMAERIVLS